MNKISCTRVLIRRKGGVVIQVCDVYVGRRCTMRGWNLKEHKLCDPYKVGTTDGKYTLEKSLIKYENL